MTAKKAAAVGATAKKPAAAFDSPTSAKARTKIAASRTASGAVLAAAMVEGLEELEKLAAILRRTGKFQYGSDLWKSWNLEIQALSRLIRNPRLPEASLAALLAFNRARLPDRAKWDLDSLHWRIAENPKTPRRILMQLAEDVRYTVRNAVAENSAAPARILLTLSDDPDSVVRTSVAENPKTPPDALAQLSRKRDWGTRMGVAENLNTPPASLAALMQDKDEFIAAAATKNPRTPVAALMAIIEDAFRALERNPSKVDPRLFDVIQNPKTSGEDVARIASAIAMSQSVWGKQMLTYMRRTPVKVLGLLARDRSANVRLAVAHRRNCPPSILALLATDPRVSVRKAAKLQATERSLILPDSNGNSLASAPESLTKIESILVQVNSSSDPAVITKFRGDKSALVRAGSDIRAYELGIMKIADLKKLATNSSWRAMASKYLSFSRDHGMRPLVYVDLCVTLDLDRALATSLREGWKPPAAALTILGNTKGMASSKGTLLTESLKSTGSDMVIRQALKLRADDFLAAYVHDQGIATPSLLKNAAKAKMSRTCWACCQSLELTPTLLSALVEVPSWSLTHSGWDEPDDACPYAWSDKLQHSINRTTQGSYREGSAYHVQHIVATHPQTPKAVLLKLLKARSSFVRSGLASRTDLTADMCASLLKDKEARVRAALAANELCSEGDLIVLAGDKEESVRAAAAENPKASDDVKAIASLLGYKPTSDRVLRPATKTSVAKATSKTTRSTGSAHNPKYAFANKSPKSKPTPCVTAKPKPTAVSSTNRKPARATKAAPARTAKKALG